MVSSPTERARRFDSCSSTYRVPIRILLLKLDLVVELHIQLHPRDFQRHCGREGLGASDESVLDGLSHRLLDLALGIAEYRVKY